MKIIRLNRPVLLCLISAAAAAFLLLLLPISARIVTVSGEHRLLPVYSVDTDRPMAAISFDASWGAEYTGELLDILDEYNARATFFLVNIWLEDYPDLAREIAMRGQEIGLHSVSHPHCTALDEEALHREIQDNAALVRNVTGYAPRLFRPPFGDYNDAVVSACGSCGYHCIQWSIDSLDWKDLSAEEITARVTEKLQPGAIVLFHNNGLHTAEALPMILDAFAEKGLQAVAVSDLLPEGDFHVDSNGVLHSEESQKTP